MMTVADYKDGDAKHILDLFNATFKRPMSYEYWKWRFEDNPAGKHLIKLMWDGNMLVGHYAVSALNLMVEGAVKPAALSMSTMTHPDYFGKGIFSTLATELYGTLKNQYGCECVMGFPNSNSHYGFIKNLQWRDLGVVHHLIKDVTLIERKSSPNIRLARSFSDEHISQLHSIAEGFSVWVDRGKNFMNWRITNNPKVKYYIFEYVDSSLKGFLVVKTFPSDKKGVENIYIVENGIPFCNIQLLCIFISHIVAYFSESCSVETVNTWLPLFDNRHIYYEREGFGAGGKLTYIGVCPFLDRSSAVISDYRNWYYSYSDSDIY